MNELMQTPTDNLYKFFAIGGLAFALVAFVFLLRQQSQARDQYVTAQVELQARGYVGETTPPTDLDLRRVYFRREAARAEANSTMKMASGIVGSTIWISAAVSFAGFAMWWGKVQRFEDEILRATLAKLKRENELKLP